MCFYNNNVGSYVALAEKANTVQAVDAAAEAVQAKLYAVMMRHLCHDRCHTGTGLFRGVTRFEIRVWRIYRQALHAFTGLFVSMPG